MSYSLLFEKKKKKTSWKLTAKRYCFSSAFRERDSRRSETRTNTFHPLLNTTPPPPPRAGGTVLRRAPRSLGSALATFMLLHVSNLKRLPHWLLQQTKHRLKIIKKYVALFQRGLITLHWPVKAKYLLSPYGSEEPLHVLVAQSQCRDLRHVGSHVEITWPAEY